MLNPESYALFLLKRRLRSRDELDRALTRRGVEEAARGPLLDKLTQVGLLDDRRFAKAWIQSRDSFRPRGNSVLRLELIKKGVSQAIIQEVLAERAEEMEAEERPDQVKLAREIIELKKRQYAHLKPEIRKRRVMALLMRRGFSYDIVKHVLNDSLPNQSEEIAGNELS